MRAETNFRYWLQARLDRADAHRLADSAEAGEEEGLDFFRAWLKAGGLEGALVAVVASGRSEPNGSDGQPSRSGVLEALRKLREANVRPAQVVAAVFGDIEKTEDGYIWHLQRCGNWLARDLPLTDDLLSSLSILVRYGGVEREPTDPLLREPSGRPWSYRQVNYGMRG